MQKPYPENTFHTTRDLISDLQIAIMDYLEADERVEADEIDGDGYSMYTHACKVNALTKQGLPIKITIEVA